MTDLLKRLRDVRWIAPNVTEKKAEEVCLEAANEIEKLREALRYCANVPDHRSVWQQIRNVEDVARKALGEET